MKFGPSVYVSGKTQDFMTVRTIQRLAKMYQWEVTHDWTQTVEAVGPADRAGMIPMEDQRRYAEADVAGVYKATVIIAVGHPQVTGTLIEVGIALGLRKPIWTFQWDRVRYTVFNSMKNFTHFGEDLPALEAKLKEHYNRVLGLPPYNRMILHTDGSLDRG